MAPGGMPEEAFIALFAMLAVVVAGIVLYPLVRAMARRLEGRAGGEFARAELDHLHDRVEHLEQLEGRLAELENRIEFSERLLARQRSASIEPTGE